MQTSIQKNTQLPQDQQVLADIHAKWGNTVPLSAVEEMFRKEHALTVTNGGVSDLEVLNAILIAREEALEADLREGV